MREERQHGRFAMGLASEFVNGGEDALMPEMHAVEIADGDHGRFARLAEKRSPLRLGMRRSRKASERHLEFEAVVSETHVFR